MITKKVLTSDLILVFKVSLAIYYPQSFYVAIEFEILYKYCEADIFFSVICPHPDCILSL